MLIRLLILSAFVLLVHLVVGMFARDLQVLSHDMKKRDAKDDVTDALQNLTSRRRHMIPQRTVKRAASTSTPRSKLTSDGRREVNGSSEETSSAQTGLLVNNSSVSEGSAKSSENTTIEVAKENNTSVSEDTRMVSLKADTASQRKRRPLSQRSTEPTAMSSQLPVAAALTMSDSLYNHFRPIDKEVPEDHILPFLHFGKKLIANTKTTYPASVTSSTNALDSVTNSPSAHELLSIHPSEAVETKPRPSEEEVNEDMDVSVFKSVVEKNKASRSKVSSLSVRNVGGLYRKLHETSENLIVSPDKTSANDTGAKSNDTKDAERKRLLSMAGKKNLDVLVDSNGRRKLVSVSRRPVIWTVLGGRHSINSTVVNDRNNNSYSDKENDTLVLPTQEFSSSNLAPSRVVVPRPSTVTNSSTLSRRRLSPHYHSIMRKANMSRLAVANRTSDLQVSSSMARNETYSDDITSTTEATKHDTATRAASIIEKYQLMRMAETRGGRRHSRLNDTDIPRIIKEKGMSNNETIVISESDIFNQSGNLTLENVSIEDASPVPWSLPNTTTTVAPQTIPFPIPTTTTDNPPNLSTFVPTTKILSTAVVTSVSIKGAWPSGVTEVFPLPLQLDAQDVEPPVTSDSMERVGSTAHNTHPHNFSSLTASRPQEVTTAPGNASYSMIKDLLADMNKPAINFDDVHPLVTDSYPTTIFPTSMYEGVVSNDDSDNVTQDSLDPETTDHSLVTDVSYNKTSSAVLNSSIDGLQDTNVNVTEPTTQNWSPPPTTTVITITLETDLPETTVVSPMSNAKVPLPDSVVTTPSVLESQNETDHNANKGRSIRTTTSKPSTDISLLGSSDKDFHLPLVKLYNSSTAWTEVTKPTESGVEERINSTMHPHRAESKNSTLVREKERSPRPREDSVGIMETNSSLEMALYVVAGVCVIPAAVAAAYFVRCLVHRHRKVLEETDTCSEISYQRGVTSAPASTKLPRLQPNLNWEHEKSTVATVASELNNSWEFPRSMLRLQTVLGQGNFGQVLKAEADDLSDHQGTTRLVAVKLVKEGATSRERDDLLRELDIMKQLGAHPNVVTLLGCCTEKEPYLLIMEYVMYGKLLTFLRDHRTRQDYYNFSEDSDALTSRDLTVFGYCVARGMEYLVSKGIIHRDLAARNVLVDHNKLCKIADFGMSRTVRQLGEVYEQRQTKGALPIRWMAPESLLYRVFTHKSDVWSFGILMWEIVTLGSTPYPTMGAREVMHRVCEGYRLERPAHCRPELFRVIARCWHADPAKRPDFTEIKHEVGALVEDCRQGGYVDLDRFAESSGGRTTAVHNSGDPDPELIHM